MDIKSDFFFSKKQSIAVVLLCTLFAIFINEVIVNNDSFFASFNCKNELSNEALLLKLKSASNKDLKVCIQKKDNGNISIYAYQIFSYNVIFASERALQHSSYESFLMHEAGHLKHNHVNVRRYLFIVCCLLFITFNVMLPKLKLSFKKYIVILIVGSIFTIKLCQYIYIHQEYVADSIVSEYGDRESLIAFFKRNPDHEKTWRTRLFVSHPQNSNRVLNLEKRQRKFDLF